MAAQVKPSLTPASDDAWGWAVRTLAAWEEEERRVDWLLEELPGAMPAGVRARTQALVLGTLRQLGRIEKALAPRIQRPPRPTVRAALWVAGYELLAAEDPADAAPKIGHHLVERVGKLASAGEAKFANAVVRHLARDLVEPLAEPSEEAPLADWARFYSHPEWLIERWWEQWGRTDTRRLLELHQTPATVTVRWRAAMAEDAVVPAWLESVDDVPDFYRVPTGRWPDLQPLLASGVVQVQDVATRHAVEALAPQVGETVLDLCAAPGGKSLALADALQSGGVVSVDLPGRRQARLAENLQRFPGGVSGVAVPADVIRGLARTLSEAGQPTEYPAVLIDVPCSNTGVMRHRVDVRWRLEPGSFRRHARQQLVLLNAAAERVAPDGRLVYSTCSIDREENEQLVSAFVRRQRGAFVLEESRHSRPWETACDGAAVFLLRRV